MLDALHGGDAESARLAMARHLVRMRDLRVATLVRQTS